MKKRRNIYFWAGAVLTLLLLTGTDILWGEMPAGAEVLWHLRVPRAVTALLAGASLALAGTQMQSVLRNPLADPHIMGVSSGAALGAALVTMYGPAGSGAAAGMTIAGAAFAGALLTASVILFFSKRFRSAATLLIFGVMLGFIVNALVSILQFSSDAESLRLFYSWSAGSFSTTTWTQTAVTAAALVTGYAISHSGSKGLDIILFGDEFASMSGAAPDKIRLKALLSSCILTGAVTAFCGPIGFVGIIAPHIARGLTGTSAHKVILPASCLTGSIIGISADLLSQASPTPLPIASTMAVTGIPVILYILIRNNLR